MSNPQDKAKELFNKMYNCELDISYYAAKQCALIAVDEILNKIEYSSQADELSKVSYYQEVKKEIELL